ncbi:MAG: hypothetical protein ACJ8IR_03215 [Alphaproteobacteria bacterium]
MTFGRHIEHARQSSAQRRLQRSPLGAPVQHGAKAGHPFTTWRQPTESQLIAVAVGATAMAWFSVAAVSLLQGN